MDLLHMIDRLEELVANAQRVPLGQRAIVDRAQLLAVIDQMRVTVPGEVRDAREIVAETDAIRRNAEEEARLLVARAEERAAALVGEHQVTRAARQRADELAAEAERQAQARVSGAAAELERRVAESRRAAAQQMASADQYAQDLLQRLDRQLGAFRSSVRDGLEQLALPPAEHAARAARDEERAAAAQAGAILAAANAAPRSPGDADLRAGPDPARPYIAGDPAPPAPPPAGGAQPYIGADPAAPGTDRPGAPAFPPHAGPQAGFPAGPGVIDDFAMPPLDDEPDEEAPRAPSPV